MVTKSTVQFVNDTECTEAIEHLPRALVYFYADWCGTCKLFAPSVKRMSENPDYADIPFFAVNSEEGPIMRKRAGVVHLPFFAAFRNGECVEGVSTAREDVVVDIIHRLRQ
jgi:thioredoxin 1